MRLIVFEINKLSTFFQLELIIIHLVPVHVECYFQPFIPATKYWTISDACGVHVPRAK